ncbi:adenylyl-sulfate reductase subunit alpha [Ammonifex thiophilus]|uniref:FAD-dependent oxidoreductase n=1 Tax=Ammonifex thiophilus TaxID=444093 RepID=A0A3D8P409_9THEO|nr:adenylyl-sulfate reductase subunit alpha [Ammonifex thiophilus]RDV83635.1 FAD-dependent oxidoreductase [Ammonifex thiophilus]
MRERVHIDTDILIVGGGTAGCLAAWEARKVGGPKLRITVVDRANIRHSGSLAAGQNALNAYINQGTPEDWVAYVRYDLLGAPVREDILLSVGYELNETVALMEKEGLPIKKDAQGRYLRRGKWNIEVNGRWLKPITAKMAEKAGAQILNWVYVTELIKQDGRCVGAVGFGVRDGRFYVIKARAVLMAAGGAAGIWRSRYEGDAHHRMWYVPFNNGASYAMMKRIGAEMTGFDTRMIPLRIKDTYAPAGTLAIGVNAPMVNALGEVFMLEKEEYVRMGGHTAPTPVRVWACYREIAAGRGPIFMDTTRGDPEKVAGLREQYLDMSPTTVLYWAAHDIDPAREPIEIEADSPFLVGAHAACCGAWTIGITRMTTIPGLFASGEALGQAPSRYISGCWTCGRIAGRHMVQWLEGEGTEVPELDPGLVAQLETRTFAPLERWSKQEFFTNGKPVRGVLPREMEAHMQNVMEDYCGGRIHYFTVSEPYLEIARRRIDRLRRDQLRYLVARDLFELERAWDVINRLDCCQLVIEHISYRKETRYLGFVTRTDYPERNDAEYDCFICSVWHPETDTLVFKKYPYEQIVPGDRTKETI